MGLLGWAESQVAVTLPGVAYQTPKMDTALLTCSEFSDIVWPFQKQFSGKQEGTKAGGKAGLSRWPRLRHLQAVVLQPEKACHMLSKHVPRTRGQAGRQQSEGRDAHPEGQGDRYAAPTFRVSLPVTSHGRTGWNTIKQSWEGGRKRDRDPPVQPTDPVIAPAVPVTLGSQKHLTAQRFMVHNVHKYHLA